MANVAAMVQNGSLPIDAKVVEEACKYATAKQAVTPQLERMQAIHDWMATLPWWRRREFRVYQCDSSPTSRLITLSRRLRWKVQENLGRDCFVYTADSIKGLRVISEIPAALIDERLAAFVRKYKLERYVIMPQDA